MKKPHLSAQLIGTISLCLVLTGLVAGFFVLNRRDTANEKTRFERQQIRAQEDSIRQAIAQREQQKEEWARQKQEREANREKWEQQKQENERKHLAYEAEKARREAEKRPIDAQLISLHPFDPNTADSVELVYLGFTPRMAGNMLKYRRANGRYRKTEDLRKIYDMTDSLYLSLEPYVQIAPAATGEPFPQYVSYKKDTILNINTADTAELKMIWGIGDYTARKIVEYRHRLGGFYTVEQLREVPNIQRPDSLMAHFYADPADITPLYINRLSVDQLNKHPYLRFEQAQAIRDYRHRKGEIQSLDVLKTLKINGKDAFTETDIRRLQPYICLDQ